MRQYKTDLQALYLEPVQDPLAVTHHDNPLYKHTSLCCILQIEYSLFDDSDLSHLPNSCFTALSSLEIGYNFLLLVSSTKLKRDHDLPISAMNLVTYDPCTYFF